MSLFLLSSLWIVNTFADDPDILKAMSTTAVLSSAHQLSVSIKITEAHDAIDIYLCGPSDVYYAIGFGSAQMADTRAVIVTGDGEAGWFEQTLANHESGSQPPIKSFEMLESKFTAQSFLRRIHLKKALTSLESAHPFNVDNDAIDVIWAIGSDSQFTQHIEHGTQTLFYEGVPDASKNPNGVWLYFGGMNLGAIIIVLGMALLFLFLFVYWLWKVYKYFKRRADERESVKHEKDENDPLLNNRFILL